MSFEDDVNQAVKAGIENHMRFYVDTYLAAGDAKAQAEYRGLVINHEQSWFTSNIDEGARLKVVEYLDSHPHAKQQAIDYVAALHRAEASPIPSMGSAHPHSEAGRILQEQLHRLEGGFLFAVVQGVANEHWHDPAAALDNAGLAVTVAGLLETAAEAKVGGIESANRFHIHEAQAHREEFVHEAGKEEVNRSISEIGGKSTAENWPNTGHQLGTDRIHELESNLGKAETGDLIRELHPEGVPGESAWREGNVRHPEFFAHGAEKHEGASDNRDGHAGHEKGADALEHLAYTVNHSSANLPADKPQPEQHAQRGTPLESGMSVPEHLVPHSTHQTNEPGMSVPEHLAPHTHHQANESGMSVPEHLAPHTHHQANESGMSVPEHLVPHTHHHANESGMSVPEHLVPHAHHHADESGMSVPEHLVPHAHHHADESGMSVPEHLAPHAHHHADESGMSVPEHLAPHSSHATHHAHDTAANTPSDGSAHGTHHQAHAGHDVGLDGGVH
jgi:hypothetical protein